MKSFWCKKEMNSLDSIDFFSIKPNEFIFFLQTALRQPWNVQFSNRKIFTRVPVLNYFCIRLYNNCHQRIRSRASRYTALTCMTYTKQKLVCCRVREKNGQSEKHNFRFPAKNRDLDDANPNEKFYLKLRIRHD